MFRANEKARDTQTNALELDPQGKADGFVYLCEQSSLIFGHDRREPVQLRPVVTLRWDGQRAVVLPCTSKIPGHAADFFELVKNRHVFWSQQPADSLRSFAYYRYESISRENLGKKTGIMPQDARLDLHAWLRTRY